MSAGKCCAIPPGCTGGSGSERARRVRYLVISAGGRALDACEVIPDGLTFVEGADGGRRVAFTVTGIASGDL